MNAGFQACPRWPVLDFGCPQFFSPLSISKNPLNKDHRFGPQLRPPQGGSLFVPWPTIRTGQIPTRMEVSLLMFSRLLHKPCNVRTESKSEKSVCCFCSNTFSFSSSTMWCGGSLPDSQTRNPGSRPGSQLREHTSLSTGPVPYFGYALRPPNRRDLVHDLEGGDLVVD